MEVGVAESRVRQLLIEIHELQQLAEAATRQATALENEATGLANIVRAYVDTFPTLESLLGNSSVPGPGGEAPRGAEAVRLILQAEPDREWFVSELVNELRERDWLPDSDNPANAVRTALERLISSETSDIRKSRTPYNKVVYSYSPDYEPDAPNEPTAANDTPGSPQTYDYGEEPF